MLLNVKDVRRKKKTLMRHDLKYGGPDGINSAIQPSPFGPSQKA